MVAAWAPERLVWLDNLKVLLIAAIIAIHGVLSYAGSVEVWSYTEYREVTLSPVTEGLLVVLVAPFGLFVIALLFLVAGLLTPPAVHRSGAGAYVRGRLLRLGVPFVLFVLLVQPALMYALERPLGGASRSYWYEILGTERRLDTGPLWFVGVLLIFSLGYAGYTVVRRRRRSARPARPITAGNLLAVLAVVAPASFLVRLVYPYGGESGFADLNFWQWPACLAVFALGIAASGQGWLRAVPEPLRRRCRAVTLPALVAMAGLLLAAGLLDRVDDGRGGWNWWAAGFAGIESTLSVFGPVWLLAVAQRRLRRRLRWGPVLSRTAYGAFIVQGVFLIGLAVALRPVPLPAEAKALLVAGGGVAASFAVAWLLVSRIRGLARIL